MKRLGAWLLLAGSVFCGTPERLSPLTIDYPADGSIFPPDMAAPTFLWRDADQRATVWLIEITFADGSRAVQLKSKGERMHVGEIDPKCVSDTNEIPKLTPEQADSHTWKPDATTWEAIKRHSTALVTVSGLRDDNPKHVVSKGSVKLLTSIDPVGAPIFYRDVPLMPSEVQKGFIKPLPANAVPLIAWRLRSVGEPSSRLLMDGLHTCANCHSFSSDGKTLGMDMDGPVNDKGIYTLVGVQPKMNIGKDNVIHWSSFRGRLGGRLRVGFMSQVSPDGNYVVTTINDPGAENRKHAQDVIGNYYVTNFKDYRFLQVFYPTRGILAWYSRETQHLQPLPGANDPKYVQTGGVWSPDGKYVVFSRAEARDAFPEGIKAAEQANDPNETQIQYDLYRVPFNDGRGGSPEPVVGASANGMSNNFAKVSPDGKWIVFVQCRNGQLMRPDSQLYIVPAQGGAARRMRCNTSRMNSWHSFSPNGHWMVFSSKARSPYTQMYLTHIDADGNDSPPILIENSTAANRAVNIPEFVNIPADGLVKIDAPVTDYYRVFDLAADLTKKAKYEAAIPEWSRAVELNPEDPLGHINYGTALARAGRENEAVEEYKQALAIDPGSPDAHTSMGAVLASAGRVDEAIAEFEKALATDPDYAEAHSNLGAALLDGGQLNEALVHCKRAVELSPDDADVQGNFATVLAANGRAAEAIPHFEKALAGDPGSAAIQANAGFAYLTQGNAQKALEHLRQSLKIQPNQVDLLNQVARMLATSGDDSVRNGKEAVQLAERANEIAGGGDPTVLETLADAYAETGRLPEAVQTARKALDMASERKDGTLVAELRKRVAQYESKLTR